MPDYKEKMLVLLVEKYRRSRKDSGTSRIHRVTRIKPSELYRSYHSNDGDMEHIEAVNDAAAECSKKGFLTYQMNGFSNEIAHLDLIDEKIDQVELYLKQQYHYTSKGDKIKYVEEMIARYSSCGPAAKLECGKLRAELEKNRIPVRYLQMEDILKALEFIEGNRSLLYIREASMLIYGNSKYLEENSLESVCRLLRSYLKRPCEENELPDEILNEYHIIREKQKICLKGDITLVKVQGRVDLAILGDGVEFYADELEEIKQIIVHVPKLVTVENKTSYLRCHQKDTVFFYLEGYANRFQRDFLKLVYRDNPTLTYLHFGDIDAGGFYIHEHLCRVTGVRFGLHRMSIGQLREKRYLSCLQKLTDNDRVRLRSLREQDAYREIAEYMLKEDVKLEQEIISFYGDS